MPGLWRRRSMSARVSPRRRAASTTVRHPSSRSAVRRRPKRQGRCWTRVSAFCRFQRCPTSGISRHGLVAGTPPRILVGIFGAAHGIRGEVRLKSYTADPAAIGGYGQLYDEGGARRFSIDALRPISKDLFVARVAGVADRSAAEALNGVRLFAARDALPPPEEEE